MVVMMKVKLNVDMLVHLIFGVCNLLLAYVVFGIDLSFGLLLFCNVVVCFLVDGMTFVEVMDLNVMVMVIGNLKFSFVVE